LLKLNLLAKLLIGIIKLFLVVEHNRVSGTEHKLQNRSKPSDVPAGHRFGDDSTRADAKFWIPSSFFSSPSGTPRFRDERSVLASTLGAERVAQGRGRVDHEIIFRPEDGVAQGAGSIRRGIKRQYHRQSAPRIQKQLQNETNFAA
jgi:hypothetical protein